MPRKGKRIGSVKHTLGLAESKEHRVSAHVPVKSIDVSIGEEYYIELAAVRGQSGDDYIDSFTANVDKQSRFCIPKPVIESNDKIEPGRTIRASLFESVEEEEPAELADDAKVLDRVEPVADSSQSDGLHSGLHSATVWDHLQEGNSKLKFRNTRTQKEAIGEAQPYEAKNERGYRFSFPYHVRQQIEAESGDLIEVIAVSQQEATTTVEDKDVEELIREMHSMMMEMYNTYLEQHGEN